MIDEEEDGENEKEEEGKKRRKEEGRRSAPLFLKPRSATAILSPAKKQRAHGGGGSLWRNENTCISGHLHSSDRPYSLSMLLELAADKNRSIVLGGWSKLQGHAHELACRLRHLRVTNFIVCALDHETYKLSILQFSEIHYHQRMSAMMTATLDFGTKCFQQVTKVKSRIVLEIFKLGYNVLLSDVDVYWFDNPVPFLYSLLGPATFGAQSDEYSDTAMD